jgi:hypothetical protein
VPDLHLFVYQAFQLSHNYTTQHTVLLIKINKSVKI